jgi:hypothetical protein
LISTVHNIPVAFNGSLVRMLGGEMQFAHFLCFFRLPALSRRLVYLKGVQRYFECMRCSKKKGVKFL